MMLSVVKTVLLAALLSNAVMSIPVPENEIKPDTAPSTVTIQGSVDPKPATAAQDPVTITPCKNNATEIFEYFKIENSPDGCTGDKLMCTPFGCLMGGDNTTAACYEKDYIADSCTLSGGSIVYCVPPGTTGLRNGTACAFPVAK